MDWKIKGLGALAFVMLGIGAASAAGTAVAVDPEAMVRNSGDQRPLLVGADKDEESGWFGKLFG